jgi:uncharacterized protein YukE
VSVRAGQWDLLGHSTDPVPAGSDDVHRVERDFAENGRVMSAASSALQRLAGGDGWKGSAAKHFAEKAEETYGDLQKAASKYTDAADALRVYAGHVTTARAETLRALRDAEQAHADKQSNATSSLEGVDDPTDAEKTADDKRQERYDGAVTALQDARTRLEHALDTLEHHASTCANDIGDASDNFKDSTMDDIKGAVASVLKVLVDALSVIAVVLAIIIVILAVFTSVVLAPFLLAAAILGGVIFALTLVQYGMGDATLADVGWASLGLIGGGFGRLAGTGVKAAAGAARISLIARSGRQAARALPLSVKFGRFVPIAGVRAWANGIRTTALAGAMRQTIHAIDGTALKNPILKGLQMDDAADAFRAISAMRGMDPGLVNSIRLSVAHTANYGVLAGSVMENVASLHDMTEFRDKLTGLPDTFGDMESSFGDVGDGVPDREISVPDLPPPLPSHLAPAGR